jgi:hypothetical protein
MSTYNETPSSAHPLCYLKDKDGNVVYPIEGFETSEGHAVQLVAQVTHDGSNWVLAGQPDITITGDLIASMGDLEKLLAKNYWKAQRFDWTSGDLDYKGLNTDANAAESDADWYVWKFTWVDGNPTLIQGPLVGSWTDRAALSW